MSVRFFCQEHLLLPGGITHPQSVLASHVNGCNMKATCPTCSFFFSVEIFGRKRRLKLTHSIETPTTCVLFDAILYLKMVNCKLNTLKALKALKTVVRHRHKCTHSSITNNNKMEPAEKCLLLVFKVIQVIQRVIQVTCRSRSSCSSGLVV